ncbi:hypothetical protein SEA_SCAP1_32 [Streptomyces phage Scap1]|uniref:Uncharacterized protein n=1 Tax=Streptomyces phage Scap1 TaxID=2041354 RepID=A0A2D1GP22_9CAUD|nr:hypothetical protein FDI71_gp32 [Streptomyces phage Scap1]ATN93681.1 hypothetical protein SEA_SCAP1_32 [Streptomyces phage Scap1]
MKITPWNLFKLGLAVAAGVEIGRVLPHSAAQVLHMVMKGDIKREYHRRMKAAEARGETVNLADFTRK